MADRSPDGTVLERHGSQTEPTVVLIHGLGLNREVWQWQVPALCDSYHVLTYDLFGHGASAEPPIAPSLAMFSDQLRDLLDHCTVG